MSNAGYGNHDAPPPGEGAKADPAPKGDEAAAAVEGRAGNAAGTKANPDANGANTAGGQGNEVDPGTG